MNAQDEETYVRNVILPKVFQWFRSFTELIANREFIKLAQLYSLGCSAQDFQAAVEENEKDSKFVVPPNDTYDDVEYAGKLVNFQQFPTVQFKLPA
ncbi:hypothetical protein BH11CYA1_BH11CYA1_40390 [soil metagenome]